MPYLITGLLYQGFKGGGYISNWKYQVVSFSENKEYFSNEKCMAFPLSIPKKIYLKIRLYVSLILILQVHCIRFKKLNI